MRNLPHLIITSIFISGLGIANVSAATGIKPAADSPLPFSNIRTQSSADIAELLRAAYELYTQKKYDAALELCMKAIAESPTDPRGHTMAGIVYMGQWKMKSASEAFAKSLELKPEKKIYLLKAQSDQYRGAKEEALAACQKALELDPSFAQAYLVMGDTYRYDEKHREEAIKAYQTAIKLNPQLAIAQEKLAGLLADTNDEGAAEAAYRRAMAIDPKGMSGRFELGRILVKQGRLKEARELWEGRTSDKDGTFPNFITLLERAEKLKKTQENLAQKPNDPEALVEMGFAVMDGESWVVNGRQEKAIVYFKKALEIKPGFAKAQYAICKAYVEIADIFKDKNKNLDEELAKLKRLDPKLASEIEDYRKTYHGAITGGSSTINQ